MGHRVWSKEDRAEVTLGILIKIPPNLFLDLSPITFGRIYICPISYTGVTVAPPGRVVLRSGIGPGRLALLESFWDVVLPSSCLFFT